MNKERVLRGMLCGDVGTGKTAVYAAPIGAVLKSGGRVVVMLPNLVLAGQIYSELYTCFPEFRVSLVTGRQKSAERHSADLLIGTTALLFEKFEGIDFLVVDEQHRFSKKQREWLAEHHTHLLEVSATPIPRSAALIKMGMLDYWRLKERHSKQIIHNEILDGQASGIIAFKRMKEQIAQGYQVLVVYALREDSESLEAVQSIAAAKEKFEKSFPGRVMTLHGKMTDNEKVDVLQKFKSKEADILLSTTVVEVGVTIPDLRVGMIVNAERFGMVTLHQLRGRLARHGGEGWFYMYCPNGASQDSLTRLQDVAETPDGFTLALKDMNRRGAGDLTENAVNQTGETFSMLRNIDLDIGKLEEMFGE
jgi:ATP-dependent DNA helicase RecG